MGIGQKIKQARQLAGLSQEKLAAGINVKRSTLAAWESGRNEPDSDNVKQIAIVCNVSTDYLHEMPQDGDGISPDVRSLAEYIASLPDADRQVMEKILNALRVEADSGKTANS